VEPEYSQRHIYHCRELRWVLTDNEMTLQPNTINLDAATLQFFDQVQRSSGLVVWRFDIVVIIVQLHVQAILLDDLLGSSKCLRVR
jgi:hypothetical protein